VIGDRVPLLEPVAVPDVFCSGIGAVEQVGECLRFYLYVLQQPIAGEAGRQERHIVAKLIVPAKAVPLAAMQMLAAVGMDLVRDLPELADGRVH
jgi:hypothetical protein